MEHLYMVLQSLVGFYIGCNVGRSVKKFEYQHTLFGVLAAIGYIASYEIALQALVK